MSLFYVIVNKQPIYQHDFEILSYTSDAINKQLGDGNSRHLLSWMTGCDLTVKMYDASIGFDIRDVAFSNVASCNRKDIDMILFVDHTRIEQTCQTRDESENDVVGN